MTDKAATDRAETVARLLRVFSMGATLTWIIVGVASAAEDFPPLALLCAVAIGIGFHVFADVGNDVADLPLDMTDPRRSRGPLVAGTIRPMAALWLALAMLPFLSATVTVGGGDAASFAALSTACLLIAIYNVFGKSVPVPIVADVVQGLGWAALVWLGAELSGGATVATLVAMAYVVVYIAMVNGIHGAIRDLRNDRAHGMRTTALLLRADIVDGSVVVPWALTGYAAMLHALLGGLLLAAARLGHFEAVFVAVAFGVFAAATAVAVSGYRRRSHLRRAMALGTWHLALVPGALLALFASNLPPWAVVVAVAAFLAPPLWYNHALSDLDFDLPSTDPETLSGPTASATSRLRILWAMTRPGTWLSAGSLAAIGATLGGAPPSEAAAVTAPFALIVCAANVFNDRCDVSADRVNRPDRPLVTRLLPPVSADRFVLLTGAAATVAGSALGAAAAIGSGVGLALALGYSLVLRRWLLTGAPMVALLFAAPIVCAAAFLRRPVPPEAWLGAVIVFVFILAREFLMGIPDIAGDRQSGYRTVAAAFGSRAAGWAFRVSVVCFLVVLCIPVPFGLGGPAYLVSVILFGGLPAGIALVRLGGEPTEASVAAALHTTGIVFATGLLPLLLLV